MPENRTKRWIYIGGLATVFFILFNIIIMVWNYSFPQFFEPDTQDKLRGQVFAETLSKVSGDFSGNWLPNDLFWPTVLLDNVPNYQLGELEVIRYSVRVLRDKISRLRTTDKIDPNVEAAFNYFSNDPMKWIFPSAEGKFKDGTKSLLEYSRALSSNSSHFYSRADNLNELLDQYISLFGGINTRLSNAPQRDKEVLSYETEGDSFTSGEKRVMVNIPWDQIDDNFYYAQGAAYALREMMLAVKVEFSDILKVKKAEELMDLIIDLLDQSQFEPLIICNGVRGSFWPNHSLELQSLTEDVRQKMRSLQDMLKN